MKKVSNIAQNNDPPNSQKRKIQTTVYDQIPKRIRKRHKTETQIKAEKPHNTFSNYIPSKQRLFVAFIFDQSFLRPKTCPLFHYIASELVLPKQRNMFLLRNRRFFDPYSSFGNQTSQKLMLLFISRFGIANGLHELFRVSAKFSFEMEESFPASSSTTVLFKATRSMPFFSKRSYAWCLNTILPHH